MRRLLCLSILVVLLVLPSGCASSKASTTNVNQSVEETVSPSVNSDLLEESSKITAEVDEYDVSSVEPAKEELEVEDTGADSSSGVAISNSDIKWRVLDDVVNKSVI